MKKILIGILALVMILGLVGCSSQNLENHSTKHSIRKVISEDEAYYLYFKDGEVTVSHNFYDNDPSSISGKRKNNSKSEEQTYTYKQIDNEHIECNGITYAYTISNHNSVTFAPSFMGISEYWTAD